MNQYIFKTNIRSAKNAQNIQNLFGLYYNVNKINFEFKKMYSVLNIESKSLNREKVMLTLNEFGYTCESIR
jgi:hypothetical protein